MPAAEVKKAPFPSPSHTWHDDTYPSLSPTRPELSAKGKTVVVTGGGTGIGAETARTFASAGAARIALLGRREAPLLETKASIERDFPGVEVFTAPTDITKRSEVEAAFSAFFASGGNVDVLVSNAATTGPQDPVAIVDAEKFLDSVLINLRGAIYVAQTFLRHAAKDAVVIDVNSSAAHVDFAASFTAYATSKTAVFRMWSSLAFGHPEMSVFHIQPGIVKTDMNREAGGADAMGFSDDGEYRPQPPEDWITLTGCLVSLPATFILWLASPEARFLKGKFLWANWDVDELKARSKELESTTQLNYGLGGWPFGEGDFKVQLVKDFRGDQ